MKREFALLTGSLLLCLGTHVSAQSGSPPQQAFPNFFTPFGGSPVNGARSAYDGNGPRPKIQAVNEAILRNACEQLLGDKRRIYYLSSRNFRMCMQVKGIYTREDLLFFRFHFSNHSHLDYDVDSIRFFIADTRHPGNAPVKGAGLSPMYLYGNTRLIRGKSREEVVVVLPKFTLPDRKSLMIEVSEKNGGRHLQLRTDNYTLVKARLI